jgi:lantibiotic transport system ATP-binding protein
MKYCLETRNLTHTFSEGDVVLNNINLKIPEGSIYGFLGPNGAGKTTTLRLILGLLKKQVGEIIIFNKTFEKDRIEILQSIGSLIESPSLYAHLTARENLLILQKIYDCPRERVEEVLEIVGLADTGNKKAGKFSLGMKQRLSIALALLHSPSLLILDEPTNGLDPNGIIEMRELLKKLNEVNKITIIISSHLLSEIEKLVTDIGIIHKGSILFQGTLKELQMKQAMTAAVVFETNNNEQTMEVMKAHHLDPVALNGQVTISLEDKQKIADLNKDLIQKGIDVYQINRIQNDLESIFIDLVSK